MYCWCPYLSWSIGLDAYQLRTYASIFLILAAQGIAKILPRHLKTLFYKRSNESKCTTMLRAPERSLCEYFMC
jgi:hypothetical protein